MEGVVGVVTGEQLGPQGFEYARFREFMTKEVNAAIEGAMAGGATRHRYRRLARQRAKPADRKTSARRFGGPRSWPRPLGMMQGIDETFAGAIFIGYHTGTTNLRVCARTRCRARG